MGNLWKIAIVVALVAAVTIVVVMKRAGQDPATDNGVTRGGEAATPTDAGAVAKTPPPVAGLPRLVDLGSVSCIPCKLMAPILEGLKKEYAGRLRVEFIDVNVDADAGKKYGIKLIPTQVFFDASGQERFRHEGFFSREDILGKWKELGVDLAASAAATAPAAPNATASAREAERSGP